MGSILSYKHGENSVSKVDERLWDIVQNAVAASPYDAIIRSGSEKRQANGTNHNHGWAVDVTLVDPKTGEKLPDYQNGKAFAAYEQYAQLARVYQQQTYPELNNYLRWGGYFSNKGNAYGYGAADLMHLDITPSAKGNMALGSWANGASSKLLEAYPGAVSNGGLKGTNGSRLVAQYRQQLAGSGGLVPPGVLGDEAPIPATRTRGVEEARTRYAANLANTPLPRPRPAGLAEALMQGSGVAGGLGGLAGAIASNGAPIPASMGERVRDLRQVTAAFPGSAGVARGDALSPVEVASLYGDTMAPVRPLRPGEQIGNADGSYSTELSTTWQTPDGKWVNVPSLWMGPDGPVRFDPSDEQGILGAMAAYERVNGPTFERFPDVQSAVSAAEARSAAGGAGARSLTEAFTSPPIGQTSPRGAVGQALRSGMSGLTGAGAGLVSPAALSVTPRLPEGMDFTRGFTVTPAVRAALTGAVPRMDQSSEQARSTVFASGLGSLLGSRQIAPGAVPNSGRGVVDRGSAASSSAARSSSSSSSSRDPVGSSANNFADLQRFLMSNQQPARVNTGQGVAGRVALPSDVRPSALPPPSIAPAWTTQGRATAQAALNPAPVVRPAVQQVLASTRVAPPSNRTPPAAGQGAALRGAASAATGAARPAGTNPLLAGAMAASGAAGRGAAPGAPAMPAGARPQVPAAAPVPMPAAARPRTVSAPVPQPREVGHVARTNALPDLVQGTNGYWYQPQLDGSYASMRTTDEALARSRANTANAGVLTQLDTAPPGAAAVPGANRYTASMTPNPYFKPTLGGAVQNWFDSTLIGRGMNLVQGKPQAPLGGGGLLGFVLGPQKGAAGGAFGGGLFGQGGASGGLLGAISPPSTSTRQYTAAGLAQGDAIRRSASPVYSVSGDDMRFQPTSVQNSTRWLTGY